MSTQASTEGLTRSHRTTAEGVNGRAKSSRAGREHGCSTVPARDTRRAAPRPDMARVVSTEREVIGAASEAVSHRSDHAGVADNPPGPLLLWLLLRGTFMLRRGRRLSSCFQTFV